MRKTTYVCDAMPRIGNPEILDIPTVFFDGKWREDFFTCKNTIEGIAEFKRLRKSEGFRILVEVAIGAGRMYE